MLKKNYSLCVIRRSRVRLENYNMVVITHRCVLGGRITGLLPNLVTRKRRYFPKRSASNTVVRSTAGNFSTI